MSDRPRIELSTVQVVSSMGAAVTGAVLTSYLGDGGTILGTAVGAGVSTTGFAVYKHYLARTKDKVAPVIVEHARQWTPTTQSSGHAAPPGTQQAPDAGGQTRTDLGQTGARFTPTRNDFGQAGPDASQTRRDLGQTGSTGQARSGNGQTWGPGAGRTRADVGLTDTQPAQFGTVRMGSDGRNGANGSGRANGPNGTNGDGGKHSGGLGGAARRLRGHPRWVITAVTSVAVFLIAMLVITLIEFGTGKPISASVWGHQSTGTTLGGVTGGGTSSKSTVQPTTPASSGTPGQSASPGVNNQVQPTSGTTPAPSPSAVPSAGATSPAQTTPATTGATAPGKAAQ
ncbi:MAG: hypothetical protein ACLPKE_01145 [Streptosporangiaceae bacterium]